MGDRYYPVELTVPPSTTPGNPAALAVPLEDNTLVDVEIIVPAGHVALTGVRVLSSNQQVIPWGNLSWIKADNYVRVFEYNAEIGAKSMSVNGFNVDVIPHTFYLRFHIRDRVDANSGTPSGLIGGVGTTVSTGTGAGGTPVGPPVAGPPPPIAPPPPVGVPAPPGLGGGTAPAGNVLQQTYFLLI
jgi:hypothetical protein